MTGKAQTQCEVISLALPRWVPPCYASAKMNNSGLPVTPAFFMAARKPAEAQKALARARSLASKRMKVSLRLLLLRSRQRSFKPALSRAGPCASVLRLPSLEVLHFMPNQYVIHVIDLRLFVAGRKCHSLRPWPARDTHGSLNSVPGTSTL